MGIMIRSHYSRSHPFVLLLLTFLVLLLLHPISYVAANDNTKLVYKVCSDQKLHDPSQNLKSLLGSLVSQSSTKAFFTTISGSGRNNVMMGLYQCRGDLTDSACYSCVSKVAEMMEKLCGKVEAARVQLSGCYLRYEVVGYKQVPETQLLYKVCGSHHAADGFEMRRDSAFVMVTNGVKSNGEKLFYSGSYQSLNVMGQCEGDLATDDCGDCVKSAEEQAKAECGDSVSAQIHLHKCYVSYSFYPPKGVSSISSSPGSLQQQQKIVAIAVGVFAALSFLIVCLLCLKSVLKKRDDKYFV